MTERVIPCSEAVRRLWDYLDQTLSPDDLAQVQDHLSFCRRCCGELEFAKELRSFLASAAIDQIPPEAKARLQRFVDEL